MRFFLLILLLVFAKDKNIKRLDSIDAGQTYKWIMQDMFHVIDQALTLLKQQPTAGEWTKKLRVLLATQDRTAVVQEAYDLCGRLDRAEARLKVFEQQPTAGKFTKRVRTQPYDPRWKHTVIIRTEDRDELCDRLDRETFEHLQIQQTTEAQFNARLDRAEAEKKDLLEGCKTALSFVVAHDIQQKVVSWASLKLQTLIAKSKKEE